MRHVRVLALAAIAASALLTAPRPAAAVGGDSTARDLAGIEARVTLSPSIAKVGESVTYRARVLVYGKVQWLPPEPDSEFTWGAARQGLRPARLPARRYGNAASTPAPVPSEVDTSWIEIPLQVFRPGVVPIPGLRFRLAGDAYRVAAHAGELRMPTVNLIVVNVLTAADSAKGLKDVHGPLGAPWWERVPWRWVLGGLGVIVVAGLLMAWLRRRKPVPVSAPVTVRLDPMAEALAALRELRGLQLPETGRFGEHAFRLGQILRRYLEATVRLTMPGDTTPELVAHLRSGGLANDDVQRLTALLRLWDRVKFAREPLTVDEARRTEGAVEAYVRAKEPAAGGEPGRVA